MAVYRCPACGDTVRKEAKRCWTCGTVFDMDHEPVLDEGQGKPTMAVYHCPACGDTVRKEAKRCRTCGLWFDLEHEPVLDDGQGKPENVKKKEKKGALIAIVVFVAIVIILSVWGAITTHEYVGFLERKGYVQNVTQSKG